MSSEYTPWLLLPVFAHTYFIPVLVPNFASLVPELPTT